MTEDFPWGKENQMSNYQEYVEVVGELNAINVELKKQIKRREYLKYQLNKVVVRRNGEQPEAHTQRINWHKPKILRSLGLF